MMICSVFGQEQYLTMRGCRVQFDGQLLFSSFVSTSFDVPGLALIVILLNRASLFSDPASVPSASGKFPWNKTIRLCLKSEPDRELSLKKLQRKVSLTFSEISRF